MTPSVWTHTRRRSAKGGQRAGKGRERAEKSHVHVRRKKHEVGSKNRGQARGLVLSAARSAVLTPKDVNRAHHRVACTREHPTRTGANDK